MDIRKASKPFPQGFKLLVIVGVLLSCIYLVSQFKLSRFFPIKTVHVYGVNRVDQQELQDALNPLLEQGFFATHLEGIRNRLRNVSWVSDIQVRRNWPDLVDVTVVEKNAIARWKDTGLLSANGEIFAPKISTYPEDLPTFNGPPGKQIKMLEHFKNINRILGPLHAKITYLELSPYDAWKLKLDNGITLQLGQKDILTTLTHFVKVYPKIIGDRAANVDYVDLRYSNGMAVKMKTAV